MTKIKSIVIRGLRGVREELKLHLDGRSLLVYGDNGSGKSSITDSLEWFYEDKIDHLSNEEIGRKGFEGMRNIFLQDDEPASLVIEYSKLGFYASKNLFLKKSALKSDYEAGELEFESYLEQSKRENLILRYRDLAAFILSSKKEKLDTMSEIIGFSEVSKNREMLRKIVGELNREFKKGDFDNRINVQQQNIIAQMGRNIVSDAQFVAAMNEAMAPLKLDVEMKSVGEFDTILSAFEAPEDKRTIQLEAFFKRISGWAAEMTPALEEFDRIYKDYYLQFNKIIGDIQQLSKILLERLLDEGSRLLKDDIFTEEACPLCLQPLSRKQLLDDLDRRIGELKSFKQQQNVLDELKRSLLKELNASVQQISSFLREPYLGDEDHQKLADVLEELKRQVKVLEEQTTITLSPGSQLKDPAKAGVDRGLLDRISLICEDHARSLAQSRKGDSKFDIQRKMLLAREAYRNIGRLKRKKLVLQTQQTSMQAIYSEFVKKQQEALERFFTKFSSDIDSFYSFMNPGEPVAHIKLAPIEKSDELQGITFEYTFHDETQSPPQKYLSESHLNCLGLAFFLTSVKAFNKRNKFFVLDDVISSFDSNHRIRFKDLLLEKFSDYQIILLTHERDWFDIIKQEVKGKNWLVNSVKWSERRGTYLDEPPKDLKERIIQKFEDSDIDDLGNMIRRYFEGSLMDINAALKVKMQFRKNDRNESRMVNELVTALRKHVNAKMKLESDKKKKIDNVVSSNMIGNISSHDRSVTLSRGDLKAYWNYVMDFEALFVCSDCGTFASSQYSQEKHGKIKCKCGNLEYDWG